MENLKNIQPIEDFNWDALEKGDSYGEVSKDDLVKTYDETLNTVIAIGVPTVVDAAALVYDITGNENIPQPERERAEKMMVTPREIDVMISRASRLLALAINSALQPDMDMKTLLSLV